MAVIKFCFFFFFVATSTPAQSTPPPTPTAQTKSWCVARGAAAETTLQVGLDFACGVGRGDCSALQEGGNCFSPDSLLNHASYAYNSYYHRNPVKSSCDFGGSAIITYTDPSKYNKPYPPCG